MTQSPDVVVICRKCGSCQPMENDFCSRCGARLRAKANTPKGTKSPNWPLIVGLAGGVLTGLYNYKHPVEAVMLGLTSFFIWWGVAAFIAWALRPSWQRGKPVLFAIGGLLLVLLVPLVLLVAPAQLSPAPGSSSTDSLSGRVALVPESDSATPRVQNPTPKATPTRYWRPATPTPLSGVCVPWQQAMQYVGKYQCVCGTVHRIQNSDRTSFIHFADGNEAFYGYSYDYYWEEGALEGKCVIICGTVETNYGRPRILIDDPAWQVYFCRGLWHE